MRSARVRGSPLLCDTIVMGETASIGFPFPRIGLTPDFAIAYTLPRRIGFAKARQALALRPQLQGAPRRSRSGWRTTSCPTMTSPPARWNGPDEIAALPSLALALTKRMMERADDPAAVLDFEAMAQPLCFASEDFREGLAAFREKRKPHFDPAGE